MNRRLYALHRWIAALALVQLSIWLGSGLFFAARPIERIRTAEVGTPTTLATDDGAALLYPATALAILSNVGIRPRTLELRLAANRPVYVARGAHAAERLRIDARTGRLLPVERSEAEAIAIADQGGTSTVIDATFVQADAPIEYRDKPLPAWRVDLRDGSGTSIWVDGRTGDVTARRSDSWRTYDFLYALHIMDYRDRKSFHHPLIIGMASLGALTVVSGVVLWLLRLARRFRQRTPSGARSQ